MACSARRGRSGPVQSNGQTMTFLGGWGGAGTSSFLPTGSSEWEEGPHGPALEVPLEDGNDGGDAGGGGDELWC